MGRAGFDVPIGSTSSNDGQYSYYTRMHLGWLGWVGHIAPTYRTSLSSIISAQDNSNWPQNSHFISGTFNQQTALTKASQQFLPNPSSNQIALYEPVISSGTMNSQRAGSVQPQLLQQSARHECYKRFLRCMVSYLGLECLLVNRLYHQVVTNF